ncbi:MAG: hypothetical protein IJ911_11900, partial [Salinivirgaceae bacterium]|nr:hypothetical protein [Salinivirgaceae bacterium]
QIPLKWYVYLQRLNNRFELIKRIRRLFVGGGLRIFVILLYAPCCLIVISSSNHRVIPSGGYRKLSRTIQPQPKANRTKTHKTTLSQIKQPKAEKNASCSAVLQPRGFVIFPNQKMALAFLYVPFMLA